MIPINKKKLREQNAALIEQNGRAACEARLIAWCERNPTIPCATCNGKSTFIVHADGSRDHDIANASAAKGDRAVPCETCKGWGFIRCTWEEVIAHRERENDMHRETYRGIRSSVCRERGIDPKAFDAMAAKRLPPNHNAPSPADWVRAASAVSVGLGVES